jgi:hypothetical protein
MDLIVSVLSTGTYVDFRLFATAHFNPQACRVVQTATDAHVALSVRLQAVAGTVEVVPYRAWRVRALPTRRNCYCILPARRCGCHALPAQSGCLLYARTRQWAAAAVRDSIAWRQATLGVRSESSRCLWKRDRIHRNLHLLHTLRGGESARAGCRACCRTVAVIDLSASRRRIRFIT